jgi:hypothetical protein
VINLERRDRLCVLVVHEIVMFNPIKDGESTFLSHASPFPKEHCFSESCQASPICPTGQCNM